MGGTLFITVPHYSSITLLHFAGFITGLSLYAMLGVMTLSEPSRRKWYGVNLPSDLTPLVTSLLGLVWNAGALWMYALPEFGFVRPTPLATAITFASLGFLPAVAIQVAASSVSSAVTNALTAVAYALATIAAGMHMYNAVRGAPLPNNSAFLMLSGAFALILVVLVLLGHQKRAAQRALPAAALGAFAVMSLHLTEHGSRGFGWLTEVAGHHISLLLAVAILAQDYRFALVDIFLKRALTLSAIAAGSMLLFITSIGLLESRVPSLGPDDPRSIVIVAAISVGAIGAYGHISRAVSWLVDRFLLRRVGFEEALHDAEADLSSASSAEDVLNGATSAIARTLNAESISWIEDGETDLVDIPAAIHTVGRSSFQLVVAATDFPRFRIDVGPLGGGRRVLSDEAHFLERITTMAARRINVIRVTRERYELLLRENEMQQLATEAELRALRAQLKPHFLFNALTTIGYLIRESPEKAMDTLYQLTGLLRAVLTRTESDFVKLGEELDLVTTYLRIESARFEERLQYDVNVPAALRHLLIPTLILQALVENSIKHGLGRKVEGGRVQVTASIKPDGQLLELTVTDTGAGFDADALEGRKAEGIGLSNIERRLERHFGDKASMTIASSNLEGTTVKILLPVSAQLQSLTQDEPVERTNHER